MLVTIISTNPSTLAGLREYLEQSGVASRSSRSVPDPSSIAADGANAVVLFPDDFALDAVTALLTELSRRRPRVLTLLVTQSPNRFRSAIPAGGAAPIILPKPSFGWDILDALRANARGRN